MKCLGTGGVGGQWALDENQWQQKHGQSFHPKTSHFLTKQVSYQIAAAADVFSSSEVSTILGFNLLFLYLNTRNFKEWLISWWIFSDFDVLNILQTIITIFIHKLQAYFGYFAPSSPVIQCHCCPHHWTRLGSRRISPLNQPWYVLIFYHSTIATIFKQSLRPQSFVSSSVIEIISSA